MLGTSNFSTLTFKMLKATSTKLYRKDMKTYDKPNFLIVNTNPILVTLGLVCS